MIVSGRELIARRIAKDLKEGLVLREIAPDTTVENVLSKTEADLIIPQDRVKTMEV